MLQYTRHFTPEEASATLPLVKKIVADILREGHALQQMTEVDGPTDRRELHEQTCLVKGLFGELSELGCFYKDWDFQTGLVDFPAMINGQEVLLCWRSDEDALEWYHGIEDGFAGRQRIPRLHATEA